MENPVIVPRAALEALKMKISGGLCYVGAQAKHAQLRDCDKALDELLALPSAVIFDEVLPCDVRLPPVTTIRKGCKVSTLMTAIQHRATYEEKDLAFTSPDQPVTDEELGNALAEIEAVTDGDASWPDVASFLNEQFDIRKRRSPIGEVLIDCLKKIGVDE